LLIPSQFLPLIPAAILKHFTCGKTWVWVGRDASPQRAFAGMNVMELSRALEASEVLLFGDGKR
jgi:hypothetical protein